MSSSIAEKKKRSPLAGYFKEIIYGGIDGIVTTFAVVAGFTGAALSTETTTQFSFAVVLLFGLANLFADAASMGLGNFLSVRSEKDLYLSTRREKALSIRAYPDDEKAQTIMVLKKKGFSQTDAEALVGIYASNPTYWIDFLLQHDIELSDPRGEREVLTGLTTFTSFMVFGVIPLLPFIVLGEGAAETTFLYSAFGTFLALVLLGLLKWQVIGTRFVPTLLEVVVVGGVAATLAFYVGTFFSI